MSALLVIILLAVLLIAFIIYWGTLKCENCDGTGNIKLIATHIACPVCNGKGKI